MEAARGDEQGPRGVEVGVGGGLLVARAPGEQPVAALEVGARPAPDAVEARAVADRGGQQHPVRLPLADRVAALVAAHDAAVGVDVAREEALRGGAGLVGRGARRAVRMDQARGARQRERRERR